VTHFIVKHGDVLQLILRSGSPNLGVGALQELNLVMELLSICAHPDPSYESIAPPFGNNVSLQRLRQFALALLPKFQINHQLALRLRFVTYINIK
jgi:hypothetical protein